jgi:hypothetical protein
MRMKIILPSQKGNNATYFYTGRFDEEREEESNQKAVREAEFILAEAENADFIKKLKNSRAQSEPFQQSFFEN